MKRAFCFLMILVTLFITTSVGYAKVMLPNPIWFTCKEDIQCVAIEGGCDWAVVNIDFIEEAKHYFSDIQTRIECDGSVDFSHPKPKAVCVKGQCALAK